MRILTREGNPTRSGQNAWPIATLQLYSVSSLLKAQSITEPTCLRAFKLKCMFITIDKYSGWTAFWPIKFYSVHAGKIKSHGAIKRLRTSSLEITLCFRPSFQHAKHGKRSICRGHARPDDASDAVRVAEARGSPIHWQYTFPLFWKHYRLHKTCLIWMLNRQLNYKYTDNYQEKN